MDVQAPVVLLDTSALRSRAQLGKKRAPRTRPTRAARQSATLTEEGTTEDWLYRDSTGGFISFYLWLKGPVVHQARIFKNTEKGTEELNHSDFGGLRLCFCSRSHTVCFHMTVFCFVSVTEAKPERKDDSDSEETTRGADGGSAVASQPQRVALFPGMDPSALKVIMFVSNVVKQRLLTEAQSGFLLGERLKGRKRFWIRSSWRLKHRLWRPTFVLLLTHSDVYSKCLPALWKRSLQRETF